MGALAVPGVTVAGSPPNPRPAAAPTITSTSPADGALQVPGTAVFDVWFSAPMNESSVTNQTEPPIAGLNSSWPAPDHLRLTPGPPLLPNCTVYTVGITAGTDVNGTGLAAGAVPNPWRFMTSCSRPFIVATDPRDGARDVARDATITVTFSKPMKCGPETGVNFLPPLPPPGGVTQGCIAPNVRTFTLNGELYNVTTYSVTAYGQDLNGSGLVGGLVPNPWSFTINAPPGVGQPVLNTPANCIDAGANVVITWTMQDDSTPTANLTVHLSYWNGTRSGWDPIPAALRGYPSPASVPWRLPDVETDTRVRVQVTDSAGVTASNESAPFRIVTGPPRVTGFFTVVGNATVGVPTNTTITIDFSEPMNRTTVEAGISAVPTFLSPHYTWQPTNQSVTVFPGLLKDNTTYTVTVARSVRDTCGAGRMMAADASFTFTTALAQPSAPGGLRVTDRGETTVSLAWDPVRTYLSGSPIPAGTRVTYRVLRMTNATSLPTPVGPDTTDTKVTDTGLSSDTEYTYQVIALVDGVPSARSAPQSVRTLPAFFTTSPGRLVLLVAFVAAVGVILVGAVLVRRRRRKEEDAALAAEIREVIEQIRRVRAEIDPQVRRSAEEKLQSHFRSLVEGEEGSEEGATDPRLEGLYKALSQALVRSPEVDVAHGRQLVDARLRRFSPALRKQGAAYRLLSEAEASVDSALFPGLPQSARKALLLVYFYTLEEYISHRLRGLVPAGSTLLLGERGHINVRRRGWETQWANLTLGNLLYLIDHNEHFFVADQPRWEKFVRPLLREAVEARNRTAHPSREAPPLDRVRDLVYRAMPALDAILKKPGKAVAS